MHAYHRCWLSYANGCHCGSICEDYAGEWWYPPTVAHSVPVEWWRAVVEVALLTGDTLPYFAVIHVFREHTYEGVRRLLGSL